MAKFDEGTLLPDIPFKCLSIFVNIINNLNATTYNIHTYITIFNVTFKSIFSSSMLALCIKQCTETVLICKIR